MPILKTFLIGGWLSIPLRFMPRHPPDLRLLSSLRAFHPGPCLHRSLRSFAFRLRFAQSAPAGGASVYSGFEPFFHCHPFFFLAILHLSLLRMNGHSTSFNDQLSAGLHFLNCLYGISLGRDTPSLTLLHFIPQPFAHPVPAVCALSYLWVIQLTFCGSCRARLSRTVFAPLTFNF